MENKNVLGQNKKGAATLDPHTYTIVLKDKSGKFVADPFSVSVKPGDTVVWSYDGSKRFYISFGPFETYESQGLNGHQSLTLPIETGFSSKAPYDIGEVGQPDSSSAGGVITCSTCPPSDLT